MVPALSLPSPSGSTACVAVSSITDEVPMLQLSDSEELDIVNMYPGDVEDSSPHTPAYEELMDVITAISCTTTSGFVIFSQRCGGRGRSRSPTEYFCPRLRLTLTF